MNTYQFLFLDRDGVINKHLPDDYVKTWEEFEFLPGSLEAIATCSKLFKRIVVVTNQRGVSKGLMNLDSLKKIHENMLAAIETKGGHIDKIYYCTAMHNDDVNRKPNPGMALQAKEDFPEIDFTKSVMVGDSESDMEFGRRLGMKTIKVNSGKIEVALKQLFEINNL